MRVLLDNVAERRGEWLALRQSTIGSSEVATVVGKNPYETPLELWARKTGKLQPKQTTTAMEIGTTMEPIIGRIFGIKLRVQMERANILACHDDREWATASPDFWALMQGRKIVETKFTTPRNRHIWDAGTPAHYMLQLNWQLGICGVDHGYVCGLIGGDAEDFVYENLVFSSGLFDYCMEKSERFIEHVRADIPPKAQAGESSLLAKIQGPRVEESVVVAAEDLYLVESFEEVREARARLSAQQRLLDVQYDGAKVRLLELLGNKECGMLPDGRQLTAKTSRNGGCVVAPYEYVTVSVKKPKENRYGRGKN